MKLEQIPVGRMAVFCYLVWCEESKEALVIDPGGNEEQLVEKIKQKGLNLRYIVNTHVHSDHTGGNAKMKELTGAAIVMHAEDAKLNALPEVQTMAMYMGFRPSPPVDIHVQDNDKLKIGNVELLIIHTPGHSPGGICLLVDGNLFTGDTLFVGGIGRTDLPGANHHLFIKTIREKLLSLPPNTIVWPGHHYGDSPSSTIGQEKISNPWLKA